jgi:phospholipid/cholesterol/gamma-HCH transport system substrate-binding protein
MKNSRIELKVGFFVAVGLVLLAVIVLSFSRGLTFFEHTYKLRILLDSAAGLKPTADVLMAGVPIGKATSLELLPDGRSVALDVSILSKYPIRSNAVFQVDALGFLGDQYIEVTPSTNLNAGFFQNGGEVQGESPFNMQTAVHSAAGMLDLVKTTVMDADYAINHLNRTVLSDQSLSNVNVALNVLESIPLIVHQMAQGANDLIHSNTPAVDEAVTNLLGFSAKLNGMAADLDRLIASNRPTVDATIQNLRDTSASFKQIGVDLEAGKGLAGSLLKDQEMKAQLAALISNANAMSAAFATFGSNLDQEGLWRVLWKPKHTERSDKSAKPAP